MRQEPITFTAGELRLEGMLAVPPNATRGAVLCHPHPLYGGTMDVPLIVATATALQDAGVATLAVQLPRHRSERRRSRRGPGRARRCVRRGRALGRAERGVRPRARRLLLRSDDGARRRRR